MIRSYVVTFGFVNFRLLLDTLNALEVATIQERVSAVSWMCWAIPLLITEAVLQGRKFLESKKYAYQPDRSEMLDEFIPNLFNISR